MKRVFFLAAMAAAMLLARPDASGQWGDFSSVNESIKAADGVVSQMRLDWTGSQRHVKVRLRGNLQFAEDDSDIGSLSPNGLFELEERVDQQYRKIEITSDRHGKLSYQFSRNSRRAEYDFEAKRWFSGLLLEVIRETGVNSRTRAERLHAAGGESAILAEINTIRRERSKRFYYQRLLERSDLSTATLHQLPIRIRLEFSDDAHLRIILTEMLGKKKLPADALSEVIITAKKINNEVTRANILVDVAAALPNDAQLREQLSEAAHTIRATAERQRVLEAMK